MRFANQHINTQIVVDVLGVSHKVRYIYDRDIANNHTLTTPRCVGVIQDVIIVSI